MLKKKNIAMVMAAATVATSVAPVFALEQQNMDKEALIKEVEAKLAQKYTNEDLGSIYQVKADAKTTAGAAGIFTGTVVTSGSQLKSLIEKAEVAGQFVEVEIVDKGHATVDNKVVDTVKGFAYGTKVAIGSSNLPELQNAKDKGVINTIKTVSGNQVITLTSGTEIVLNENSARLDFTKGLDKDGKKIDIPNADVETAKRVVDFEISNTYTQQELFDIATGSVITKVNKYTAGGVTATTAADTVKVVLELTKADLANASGKKEITLDLNSARLDLTKGLDASGKATSANGDIEGFAKADTTAKIPSRNIANIVCDEISQKTLKFNLTDFIAENGYTQAGKELIELLGDANSNKEGTKKASVVKDGKEYIVEFNKEDVNNLKITAIKDAGYKMNIDLNVTEGKNTSRVQLLIKSDVQKDLADLKAVIDGATSATDITIGKFAKLAGDDRFETAVEISKDAYNGKEAATDTAKAVVLVGENAVVDGLASAPLAKSANAPILLTKKDNIPASTMNEIKRLVEKGSKIYLVGGKNTISKEVEAQLIKEINANIVRLAGNDRYETSLEIAKELGGNPNKAFVVGGNGLADAMSIAAVAANAEDPIIVTPKEGLTKDAKAFLNKTTSIVDADVIGGESNVSTQVLKDLVGTTNIPAASDVVRVSGKDRNDTNAEVLAEYFPSAGKLTNVYVAKDADAQLVDALAVAPLAGETAEGAIVLATNDLTAAQEKAIKTAKHATAKENKTTQIGNGVATTVMQKVLKALGL